MEKIYNFLIQFFELLFPRDKKTVIYDVINSSTIEQTAVRIFTETSFKCMAPFPYSNPIIKNAIKATKYHSHKRAAKILGEALAPYISEELAELRMFGSFNKPVIIPIPLHSSRLNERGFNQSERIVNSVIKQIDDSDITLSINILTRHKNTTHQTRSENKKVRYLNMENAFFVPQTKLIKGKDIILVDDVITTGATLVSAQNTLLKAGARNVLCVAVAH